jgi:hypothetical protein
VVEEGESLEETLESSGALESSVALESSAAAAEVEVVVVV